MTYSSLQVQAYIVPCVHDRTVTAVVTWNKTNFKEVVTVCSNVTDLANIRVISTVSQGKT